MGRPVRAALLLRRQQSVAQIAGRAVAELCNGGSGQRGGHGASFPPHHQRHRRAHDRDESNAPVNSGGATDPGAFQAIAYTGRAARGCWSTAPAPTGDAESIARELAALQAERLPDVPQDDNVEAAGAIEQNVFRLPENTPALMAVRNVVRVLTVTRCATTESSNCPL